ncbi:putative ankyrin repeat protein [Diplodia seriata]|uniref:Putative ankyrin repeat protein n=1 Tax=Diplodia seriata TaxID=420778 RepID=A0A0G2HHZ3_9PEZI|nr:putative ankyrin repeat protein [Diplodia seriata]
MVKDINQLDSFGKNALHYSVIGASLAMTEELLTHPTIDPDAKAQGGLTPLAYAAQDGHFDIMKTLLERHASADPKDDAGKSPLEHAVLNRHADCVAELINAGACLRFGDGGGDDDEKSEPRSTVLHAAIMGGETNARTSFVGALMERADELPQLKDPAVLDQTTRDGWTPLQQAVLFGDHVAVRELLLHGANPGPALGTARTVRRVMEAHGALDQQVWLRDGGVPAIQHFRYSLDAIFENLERFRRTV